MTRAWRPARPAGVVRPLRPHEYARALELCQADPVASVMVAARITQLQAGLHPAGELWGLHDGGELISVCWSGANLIPLPDRTGLAAPAFARHALRQGRCCSAICGPQPEVLAMWQILGDDWAPAREVRSAQPSLVLRQPPPHPADPQLRPASMEEFGDVFDAAVQMFTEEVGYSPLLGGDAYRQRIAEQIRHRSIYVRSWPLEWRRPGSPPLAFKGEVGPRALGVAQLQGLWTEPSARRRGVAKGCVAAMASLLFSQGMTAVSLYVNDYNHPARALYHALGFKEEGTFATVLF